MITSRKEFDRAMCIAENPIIQLPDDIYALYDIGQIFEYGLFAEGKMIIDVDYEKSFYWYEQAMKRGSLDATLKLGDFFSEGIGCEIDLDKAVCLYSICIDKGISIAANNLATVYRYMKEYNEAFRCYGIAKELMSKEYKKEVFSLNVAMCYLYGIGVDQDIDRAIVELKSFVSADNNYSFPHDIDEANYLLGLIYIQGLGVDKDINLARKYLLDADKEQDHRSAQELLLLIGNNHASKS